jgi:hypothetical protein
MQLGLVRLCWVLAAAAAAAVEVVKVLLKQQLV